MNQKGKMFGNILIAIIAIKGVHCHALAVGAGHQCLSYSELSDESQGTPGHGGHCSRLTLGG